MDETESSRIPTPRLSEREFEYRAQLESYFSSSVGTNLQKLQNFAKYVPRQSFSDFISKYEMFKRILNIPGSVVECGVYLGGGLMTFAQLSAILEPVNHQRRIIGFDTFSGFTDLSEDEKAISANAREGLFSTDADVYGDLRRCIELYDSNRFIGHVPKVFLVKGDLKETLPKYLEENPHTVVSLLYLDLDLYEPTKVAIEQLVPRMPKGSIIAFDELDHPDWPGETLAVLETVGINTLRIQKFQFDAFPSFAVIE